MADPLTGILLVVGQSLLADKLKGAIQRFIDSPPVEAAIRNTDAQLHEIGGVRESLE